MSNHKPAVINTYAKAKEEINSALSDLSIRLTCAKVSITHLKDSVIYTNKLMMTTRARQSRCKIVYGKAKGDLNKSLSDLRNMGDKATGTHISEVISRIQFAVKAYPEIGFMDDPGGMADILGTNKELLGIVSTAIDSLRIEYDHYSNAGLLNTECIDVMHEIDIIVEVISRLAYSSGIYASVCDEYDDLEERHYALGMYIVTVIDELTMDHNYMMNSKFLKFYNAVV